MRFRSTIGCVVLVLAVSACGSDDDFTEGTSGDEAADVDVAPFRLAAARPGPDVRIVRGGCTTGADSCETRGDCEAAPVDCGPETDRLRVTAHWSTSDDVDLYVTDRNGDTLSFLRPTTFSGGEMVRTPGRTCVPSREIGEEIATYSGPAALTGVYSVVLQHFGSCMSGLGTVDVDITVSAGGRHLQSFRATLAPRDRIEAVVLDVAAAGTEGATPTEVQARPE